MVAKRRGRWLTFTLHDEPAVRQQPGRDPDLIQHFSADGRLVKVEIRDRPQAKREYGLDELFMTLNDAAERLGVHSSTVRRAAQRGTLRTRRFGNEWLTTPLWLKEYADNRRPAGRPRKTA